MTSGNSWSKFPCRGIFRTQNRPVWIWSHHHEAEIPIQEQGVLAIKFPEEQGKVVEVGSSAGVQVRHDEEHTSIRADSDSIAMEQVLAADAKRGMNLASLQQKGTRLKCQARLDLGAGKRSRLNQERFALSVYTKDAIGFEIEIPVTGIQIQGAKRLAFLQVQAGWNSARLKDPCIDEKAGSLALSLKRFLQLREGSIGRTSLILPMERKCRWFHLVKVIEPSPIVELPVFAAQCCGGSQYTPQ